MVNRHARNIDQAFRLIKDCVDDLTVERPTVSYCPIDNEVGIDTYGEGMTVFFFGHFYSYESAMEFAKQCQEHWVDMVVDAPVPGKRNWAYKVIFRMEPVVKTTVKLYSYIYDVTLECYWVV